jgi:HEAT repeat protein
VRRNAASALGSMRAATAVAALTGVLRDSEPAVRRAAASALSSIRTSEALDALRVLDPGDDTQLRTIRDRALGRRNLRI